MRNRGNIITDCEGMGGTRSGGAGNLGWEAYLPMISCPRYLTRVEMTAASSQRDARPRLLFKSNYAAFKSLWGDGLCKYIRPDDFFGTFITLVTGLELEH